MSEETRPRVLWLSNAVLEPADRGVSGTWLHAMAEGLVNSGRITLGNVTTGKVPELTASHNAGVSQWIVPAASSLGKDGLPSAKVIAGYLSAVKQFSPDLIHVWGAETFPGLLTARGLLSQPALLEIQGLKGPLADWCHGGLTTAEQLRTIGLREIVRHSTIPQEAAFFRKWGVFEKEIIGKHGFITTPSRWMEAYASAANPDARLFQNEIPLRKQFLACEPWRFSGDPIIFSSSSYPQAYKGLHVLVRAAEILREHFPNFQLRIAGAHQAKGLRLSGYIRWLNGEIRRAGLETNVHWLGSLDATDLCNELARSSVAVFPSYLESYGVAHAEAMTVGTPCVCAFNGGSAYLAQDGRNALFFQAGDHVMCAFQVQRVLESRELSEALSVESRRVALPRHDSTAIVDRQRQIYRAVLGE